MIHICLSAELNHEKNMMQKNKIGESKNHLLGVWLVVKCTYKLLTSNPTTPIEINTLEDTKPMKIKLLKRSTHRSLSVYFSRANNFCTEVNAAFLFLCNLNYFLLQKINHISDFKTLARCISLVENDTVQGHEILQHLESNAIPIIGITGPPGAGKSTLLNALLQLLLSQGKKIGLVLIDPSSPFNFGALLGDRLRMSHHFNNPNLFIRSLASRGSLGGLSSKIIEVTEVMKSYAFDYIFVETVGVGQSEVEIAGLADATVVVLVPEAGDSVQAMKAGIMEIADIFVINKADRPDAELFYNNLSQQLHINNRPNTPIVKTVAVQSTGIDELFSTLKTTIADKAKSPLRLQLITDKVYRILQEEKMKGFDKNNLKNAVAAAIEDKSFSIFRFAKSVQKN
jgi:LAO/AO transport system kinase